MSQSGTRSKRGILHDMRKGAQFYRELLGRSVTIIHRDDGSRYEIHWDKNRFRHLIGLTYKDGPAGRFYDDVLGGKVKFRPLAIGKESIPRSARGKSLGMRWRCGTRVMWSCRATMASRSIAAVWNGRLVWSRMPTVCKIHTANPFTIPPVFETMFIRPGRRIR
ncbi:PBECR4 domain-containing protein [Bifidobacterium panos]|uniref:PBECR4 domain-containing protein n=1 Tax=Bifidobacterium panos TaxID=2675321 RepID=UPI001557FB9F|nr:PBECR4 domain-containing protein [Bifidobacterium sp. DSM 109963]